MTVALPRLMLVCFCLLVASAVLVGLSLRQRTTLRAAEPKSGSAITKPHGAKPARLDPAAWGEDHVGQPLPEYVDSGECLFCHRNDIGPGWTKNKHSQTIRDAVHDSPVMRALESDPKTKALAGEVKLVMGDERAGRFLKPAAAFGHVDLLSAVALAGRGSHFHLSRAESAHWDADKFATRCAGCHTTGIDAETHSFTSLSLDCYVCHGDGPLEHANDTKLMPLAKARHDSPAVVTSICAQCHIRQGKSKSSGLPYPNNFVAGDNLFKDFELDWAAADDPKLNPADRHVLDNVREVALYGNEQLTCLSCHEIHPGTTVRHRAAADQKYCQHCHEPGKDKKLHKSYEVHSKLCEY